MFRLGEYQKLKVAKAVDFGVYLFDPEQPKDPYEGLRKQT